MEKSDAEEAPERQGKSLAKAGPTQHDREMERVRMEIAAKQEAEWVQCATWALKAFGAGYEPSCRHMLIDKIEEEKSRRTGEKAVVAKTIYTVKSAINVKRHFTVTEDGQIVECDSMEAGFGEMLLAPHPTQRIEVRGQLVAPHQFSLCFAPYELYRPMSAEGLANLRATRQRKKEEKLDQQFADVNPLFAAAGIKRQDLE